MNEDADILAAIRAALLSDNTLSQALSGRVFSGELPAGQSKSMPRPCVVIKPSGGTSLTGGSKVDHDAQRIDLLAYGETPKTANDVLRTATRVLRGIHRETHAGVLVHWCDSAGGFSSARDPLTDWPRTFQSFQIFYALKAAQP